LLLDIAAVVPVIVCDVRPLVNIVKSWQCDSSGILRFFSAKEHNYTPCHEHSNRDEVSDNAGCMGFFLIIIIIITIIIIMIIRFL